jgi:hypothetical protein
MRRAPHGSQNPRRLQLKATSLSGRQLGTAEAEEAARQDAAFEEYAELVLVELREACASAFLDLGEEGPGVSQHHAIQRGLLGTVALVVDWGVIGRPVGPPTDGLHALLPRL